MKFLFAGIISIILVFTGSEIWAQKSPYDWALIQLDYVRQEKIEHLKRFTERMHSFAQKAANDEKMIAFYEMNRKYFNAVKTEKIPSSLADNIEKARDYFNRYYIANYYFFRDILFVDKKGVVFYTIRKEVDNYTNLVNSKESIGLLANVIADNPTQEVFIDFYNYSPSSEPTAFFVEPVFNSDVQVGWIVLQCAVNKLNSIFASTDDLGQTGETFLVNHDGLMLTESYFKGYSTILKEHLDDRNIKVKFKEKRGYRIVVDYRGASALSSFEVFEFLGSKWLVVAKIDKEEITTQHYKSHNKYYRNRLFRYLQEHSLQPPNGEKLKTGGLTLRVDMDEFLKAENNEILETWGVSTCTALLAGVPEKFAYLAHISPKDKIYNRNDTNLLSQITKKIQSFDIYHCEKRKVEFVVVATHLDSLTNIINHLIEDGFFLSQIRIAYNSGAKSAAIAYQYSDNDLVIAWTMNHKKTTFVLHGIKDTVNIGNVVEGIMLKESKNFIVLKMDK
ncbi:cache domain-containing protein [Desulfobacula phenolica]|nr:cache domain-containing protein [Desulfobacula phenolica]